MQHLIELINVDAFAMLIDIGEERGSKAPELPISGTH
jgi:hypothetical protein